MRAHPFSTDGAGEIETLFAAMHSDRLDAAIVLSDPDFDRARARIVGAAAAYRIPTIYEHRAFVEAGGLLSYGPDIDALSYRAASYVDRIAKGARPSDLPVEQPTKFELLVNARTARELGVELPPALLARADEVIE
jgi:ABC-type uncharacterized transport system substrate-binding protein